MAETETLTSAVLPLKLYAAMHEARKGMPTISKSRKNKEQGYDYASIADDLEAIQAQLNATGLLVINDVTETEWLEDRLTKNGGLEHAVRVKVRTTCIHVETGESMFVTTGGEGQDNRDKAYYKAVTGARKYSLRNLFNLATDDDPEKDSPRRERRDDGATSRDRQETRKPPANQQRKTEKPVVPEFKLPPQWPHSNQEKLLAWVGELKPAAHFQAALGMFMNEPEVYGDLKRWGEVCRQLNTTYHMRLQGADEKRRASLDSITKALDGALAKLELDEQADAAFPTTKSEEVARQ